MTVDPAMLAYAAELEDRNAELQRLNTGLLFMLGARRDLEGFARDEIEATFAVDGKPDYVWQPTPLTEAAADPPARPDRFGNFIYGSAATLVSGEPGVGKSMFLAAMVAEEAMAGRTALYLDFEGSAGTLAERLEAAALSEEQIARVLYLRPTFQAEAEEIRAMIAHTTPALVALDSYDAALAAYGLETKNEDVRAFAGLVLDPLRSVGATLVVSDHVAKNREARGPYSIGGQSKLGLADVHLGLSVIAPLRRGGDGKLKVKVHKDRFGWLPRTATFELRSHSSTGSTLLDDRDRRQQ